MDYEIKGGAFPVVICHLADGQQMITEKGSMVWTYGPCQFPVLPPSYATSSQIAKLVV